MYVPVESQWYQDRKQSIIHALLSVIMLLWSTVLVRSAIRLYVCFTHHCADRLDIGSIAYTASDVLIRNRTLPLIKLCQLSYERLRTAPSLSDHLFASSRFDRPFLGYSRSPASSSSIYDLEYSLHRGIEKRRGVGGNRCVYIFPNCYAYISA